MPTALKSKSLATTVKTEETAKPAKKRYRISGKIESIRKVGDQLSARFRYTPANATKSRTTAFRVPKAIAEKFMSQLSIGATVVAKGFHLNLPPKGEYKKRHAFNVVFIESITPA
ncbi:MAG TPA: hypothetical protein P5256_08125 [Beijerinckiaceae bacterium]|nr:hypothetical protein [Hyphomicrobiales bacterium]MCO5086015.1 hypothetical protein [Methylobacteriaceae bacterium]HRY03078.1 hypothetical protein [Beijerinckiaceae bacterium]